uniref:Reverse transcriptase/retrotransposon-derived protein RNase H-like domain-containing protein n=1 Tax=Tanacetum cinerariifolium TaxID=118510 RepID=A0A6L2MGT8_TANCI|nr:hypothetical protein [Tanacetum cinerariifolium]
MSSRTKSPDQSSQEDEIENYLINFSESQHGFDASFMMKQDLTIFPKLYLPSNEDFLIIETDASEDIWGGILKAKTPDNDEKICRYTSGSFKAAEKNYHSNEIELLAVKNVILKFCAYLTPVTFLKLAPDYLTAVKQEPKYYYVICKGPHSDIHIDWGITEAFCNNDRVTCKKFKSKESARISLATYSQEVYPQYGLSLDSKDLDQVLAFVHEFERSDLMKPRNKVFSITYFVAYALTSSHHSIDYRKKEYIEIDDLFNEIGSVEGSKFAEIKPIDESWAIDIAKNKRLIDKVKLCRIAALQGYEPIEDIYEDKQEVFYQEKEEITITDNSSSSDEGYSDVSSE